MTINTDYSASVSNNGGKSIPFQFVPGSESVRLQQPSNSVRNCRRPSIPIGKTHLSWKRGYFDMNQWFHPEKLRVSICFFRGLVAISYFC
jgi:hypothetical protein